MIIGRTMSRLADFDRHAPNFIVVQEETESHMGLTMDLQIHHPQWKHPRT